MAEKTYKYLIRDRDSPNSYCWAIAGCITTTSDLGKAIFEELPYWIEEKDIIDGNYGSFEIIRSDNPRFQSILKKFLLGDNVEKGLEDKVHHMRMDLEDKEKSLDAIKMVLNDIFKRE